MSKDDNSIIFGMGLLVGVVGGMIAAILYAPKSGKETREELKVFVNDFAEKHAPEIKKAKKQALESLDMMKYKLEKQYNKINDHIKAKQMAKAKRMEDRSYDYTELEN